LSQPSQDKAAAMRAAFLSDLERRLIEVDGIAEGLRRGVVRDDEARAALLAQMHDIKGCAAPYGVPEATVVARGYERQLSQQPPNSAAIGILLAELIRDFRRILA
jgi:hypothetical protein